MSDAITIVALAGIAALVVCVAYAIHDADQGVIVERPSATWGPGYDPTEGIQPPDVYPDDLRGVN